MKEIVHKENLVTNDDKTFFMECIGQPTMKKNMYMARGTIINSQAMLEC
jgi:hypothetical protein